MDSMARLGLLLIAAICLGFIETAAPRRGFPWPQPASISTTSSSLVVSPNEFRFRVVGVTCDILDEAIVRYFRIVFYDGNERPNRRSKDSALRFQAQKHLTHLDVDVQNACEEYPSLDMDESYILSISDTRSYLTAKNIWGALRGLETFSQMIYLNEDGALQVNETEIVDKPRFAWRGVLLDTSRHYMSKRTLFENLDAMVQNKFNVFHWHIVDDQSFPYQSRDFPQMSLKGAYEPYRYIYTQADIREIIEYARLRGIRVIPEFDSPGHSLSWRKGIDGLLTKCYNHGHFTGDYGPIDPSQSSTFLFLKMFIKELSEVFKDSYLHLGGDEVDFSCWQSNPNVTEFMQKMHFGNDYKKLESYYIGRILNITVSLKSKAVVWQEVFDNNVTIHPDTVVQVWKDGEKKEMEAVTGRHLRTVLSSPWYLNRISYGIDWHPFYSMDPQDFNGTDEQKALVIGGEACMWSEYVDDSNVISRLWPRACAVAERLWSPKDVNDINTAAVRLEEHRCRMLRRGINAEPPNGPSFCL